jgi:Domain of unknown function (DUF4160)
MPEVARFYGIIISFFYNDHDPAHFHAAYGEFKGRIAIETLEVLSGNLPRRAVLLASDWAKIHRAELLKDWELARNEKPLMKIEPLD